MKLNLAMKFVLSFHAYESHAMGGFVEDDADDSEKYVILAGNHFLITLPTPKQRILCNAWP